MSPPDVRKRRPRQVDAASVIATTTSSSLAPLLAQPLDDDAARRITERIRRKALTIRDNLEGLQRLVEEAKAGNVHQVLGYPSWTAYLSETLGSEPLRLPRDQRQELVGYLAGEGMSSRAIAPIAGVSQQQVVRDRQVTHEVSPAPNPEDEDTYSDLVIGDQDQFERALTQARAEEDLGRENVARHLQSIVYDRPKVVGLDGKTYTGAEPQKVRRRPWPAAAADATYRLDKVTTTITNLVLDDRFPTYRNEPRFWNDLARAVEALQGVLDNRPAANERGE